MAAYETAHYNALLNGVHFALNHINKHTVWAKRRQKLNTKEHFRASIVYKNDLGIDIEDGYMSEVQAKSFKDDPFKSIGESATFVGFEEAGRFKGLIEASGELVVILKREERTLLKYSIVLKLMVVEHTTIFMMTMLQETVAGSLMTCGIYQENTPIRNHI
jgi:hypothetical protein